MIVPDFRSASSPVRNGVSGSGHPCIRPFYNRHRIFLVKVESHTLIDECHYADSCDAAVCVVHDKPYRENAAQRNRNQIRSFLNQQIPFHVIINAI
jgi:hypothetical protein